MPRPQEHVSRSGRRVPGVVPRVSIDPSGDKKRRYASLTAELAERFGPERLGTRCQRCGGDGPLATYAIHWRHTVNTGPRIMVVGVRGELWGALFSNLLRKRFDLTTHHALCTACDGIGLRRRWVISYWMNGLGTLLWLPGLLLAFCITAMFIMSSRSERTPMVTFLMVLSYVVFGIGAGLSIGSILVRLPAEIRNLVPRPFRPIRIRRFGAQRALLSTSNGR